jgi:hypothetical protein
LKRVLTEELKRTGDPRVTGPVKDIFESYPRYSPIRDFPKPVDTSEPVKTNIPDNSFYEASLNGFAGVVDKAIFGWY